MVEFAPNTKRKEVSNDLATDSKRQKLSFPLATTSKDWNSTNNKGIFSEGPICRRIASFLSTQELLKQFSLLNKTTLSIARSKAIWWSKLVQLLVSNEWDIEAEIKDKYNNKSDWFLLYMHFKQFCKQFETDLSINHLPPCPICETVVEYDYPFVECTECDVKFFEKKQCEECDIITESKTYFVCESCANSEVCKKCLERKRAESNRCDNCKMYYCEDHYSCPFCTDDMPIHSEYSEEEVVEDEYSSESSEDSEDNEF